MISDEWSIIRELGLQKMKARENDKSPKAIKIRRFKVAKINFEAKDYYELIDWSDLSDPPILKL